MWSGLQQKFICPTFKELLKNTENRQIIEWTWWNDQCWGMFDKTGTGCNALGKLLMKLRDKNE